LLGDESPPVALRGRRSTSLSIANLDDLKLVRVADNIETNPTDQGQSEDIVAFARRATLDAYTASRLLDEVTSKSNQQTSYPRTALARRLKSIAQLIKANFAAPIYYALQADYDTHAGQLSTHARLLAELSDALKSFHDDLKSANLDQQVLTLCFSEFGRRVEENASLGTDHGTAGPVLIVGPVNSALIGNTPSMTDLEDGDLKMQFDFRQVYATVLEDWLSIPSSEVLGESFERLKLLGPI
jgi:uncharacterized protein (DUF1501 family)